MLQPITETSQNSTENSLPIPSKLPNKNDTTIISEKQPIPPLPTQSQSQFQYPIPSIEKDPMFAKLQPKRDDYIEAEDNEMSDDDRKTPQLLTTSLQESTLHGRSQPLPFSQKHSNIKTANLTLNDAMLNEDDTKTPFLPSLSELNIGHHNIYPSNLKCTSSLHSNVSAVSVSSAWGNEGGLAKHTFINRHANQPPEYQDFEQRLSSWVQSISKQVYNEHVLRYGSTYYTARVKECGLIEKFLLYIQKTVLQYQQKNNEIRQETQLEYIYEQEEHKEHIYDLEQRMEHMHSQMEQMRLMIMDHNFNVSQGQLTATGPAIAPSLAPPAGSIAMLNTNESDSSSNSHANLSANDNNVDDKLEEID